MGSKYPVLKPQAIMSILKEYGFQYKSQRGSHVKYVKDSHVVIIPMHDEVAKGTLKSILEQAGIEIDDFIKHI